MAITYEPKPLTANELRTLSQEVKQALIALYGDRLNQVILYGSYARGDFHAESDVDYLVVLNDETIEFGKEIWYMGNAIGSIAFDYNMFISAKPTTLTKYKSCDLLFYKNVHREGITL